jgi:hypothetical protein
MVMVVNRGGQAKECSTRATCKSGKEMTHRSENIFKKSGRLGILKAFFKAL